MDDINMDLHTLEQLMIEYGACIRAVPKKIHSVCEVRHINDPCFSKPNIVRKEIVFLEDFKREMLVVEEIPKYAGMFFVETGLGTSATVRFYGKQYYKSLNEAVAAIKKFGRLPANRI